jgi:Tol biopolymer transport system component
LYLLSADGNSLQRVPLEGLSLKTQAGWMNRLAWSADGTHLATIAADGTPYVVELGGDADASLQAPRQVTDLAIDPRAGLTWLPHGRELLAVTSGGEIVRIAEDGSSVTPIVDPELPTGDTEMFAALSGGPAWLPDGDGIIYAALERRGKGVELFRVRFDESEPQQLTAFPDELGVVTPNPSPDGQHIAAFVLTGEYGCSTVVIARDGSALHSRYWCAPVIWSPDGKWLLAIQYAGDGDSALLLDSAAGPRSLVSPVDWSVFQATWAPDSDRFAFTGAGEQISVASRSGATPVAIAGIGRRVEVEAIAWSPVDDRLAVLVGKLK